LWQCCLWWHLLLSPDYKISNQRSRCLCMQVYAWSMAYPLQQQHQRNCWHPVFNEQHQQASTYGSDLLASSPWALSWTCLGWAGSSLWSLSPPDSGPWKTWTSLYIHRKRSTTSEVISTVSFSFLDPLQMGKEGLNYYLCACLNF